MLLFGFLLLSTVLVTAHWSGMDHLIRICFDGSIVESLERFIEIHNASLTCHRFEIKTYWFDTLNIDNLEITDFKKNWYRLQNYQVSDMILDGNKIIAITKKMFNDLPANVTGVSLKRNYIERIPYGIISNEHLMTLDLSFNLIHDIHELALINLIRLEILNLQGNLLSDTEFAASLPSSLHQLNLNHNNITEITLGCFMGLHELKKLSLGDNKIVSIEGQEFRGLRKLIALELSRNPLRELGEHTFNSTPLLNTVVYDRFTKKLIAGDDILSSYGRTLLFMRFNRYE